VEQFHKGDLPTGRELAEDEKLLYMRKKKMAKISVIVKSQSGDAEMSSIVDEFNLHLDSKRHKDNLVVLRKSLNDALVLLDALLANWEREV
jgi:hypothetical protein